MKIRSITYFCNPGWPLDRGTIQKAGKLLAEARKSFEDCGCEVQTTRLATIPFPDLLEGWIHQTPKLSLELEKMIQDQAVDYASLGPALPEQPGSYVVIPEALAATKNIFFSGIMARKCEIYPPAVQACAGIIKQTATITADGFKNLYFSALANVRPGTPFFPAAYWKGRKPAFAIATQAADLAVNAFSQAKNLQEGRCALTAAIEAHAHRLSTVARSLKCHFAGIDFSLAPFPEDTESLGLAFERMGVPTIGLHGSLTGAAIITEAIDRAKFQRCGFSGLFLPLFEDSVLARRAAEGVLSIKDLLLYCAVCGTGLDTIPLAGDIKAEQITALLMDVCALAVRLDKPLTTRLMPIPNKKAGDPVNFNFAYFSNSRVIALEALPLYNSHLLDSKSFHLHTLHGK